MMRRYTLGVGERSFVVDVQELSADRFEVVVGGQRFDVTLAGNEDLPAATITPGVQLTAGGNGTPAAIDAPRRPAGAGVSASPLPAAERARAPAGGGIDALKAPMPGLILELNVKPGDSVQRGQQVAVLEAMKMHNFIGAPRAGVIDEVCVAVGQAVGHGEAIVRFKPEPAA
jgi:biotin carboxyl carrier protein